MKEYKRRKKINMLTILLFLLLLSVLIISVTISRYQTTQDYQTLATTAKWSFKLSYNNTEIQTVNYNINLADTITSTSNNVTSDYIAPGTSGAIKFDIDCTQCNLGVEYVLRITDTNATLPEQLKFYTNQDYSDTNLISLDTDYSTTINLADIATIQNKTIYWKWLAVDTDEINAKDLAKSGTQMNVNISISGKQMIS